MTINNQKKEVSNPCDVLGISRTSSAEKARKVFLEKCKRLHPDKRLHGREEDENASFERMKAAYEKILEREEEKKREKEGEEQREEVFEVNDIECGRVAFQEKKFDTAIEFFQKALKSSHVVSSLSRDDFEEEKARIHANLSACYLKTNKFKLALEHADASFEVSKKTFPKALFRRAEALEKMREYPRAREALDQMLRMDATFVDEVHPKLRELAVKEREYEKKLAKSEREKEKRKERGRTEGQQPGTMPKWEISKTTAPRGMDDIDVEEEETNEERGVEKEEEELYEKPMIDGMGLEAIEQMMTLAQIKREEAKAMEYSDDPASLAPKEEKKNASKDFNFKRCKMCGNVCNVNMMSCSSCCLSLADASSFTPVYNLPKVASGENGDGIEENDDEDDDDKDAYASSSSDDDDDEDNDEMMRQVLPSVAATSEKQKKSLEALARRRNERQQQQQQHQTITNEVKSKDAASSSLWWWQMDPMFAPYLGGAPEHKRGFDPSLQSAYDELKIPLGSGESRVRDAYMNQIMARHPDAAGSKKKAFKSTTSVRNYRERFLEARFRMREYAQKI